MDASRRLDLADPDFDPSPGLPTRLRDFDPVEHQRLVVNPFLAVLGLIGLAWLAKEVAMSRLPGLTGLLLFPILLLPYLIHYHCLDCGRTGSYPFRRRHACAALRTRWRYGRRSRFPFPTAWAQVVVWGWVLAAVAALLVVAATTRAAD